MLSPTTKRTIATVLSGATIAGTIGAPAASAMPIDPVAARRATIPPTPPFSAPAACAADDSWRPAISRSDDLEANKANSMRALGLAMMQQFFASRYRDVGANEAYTAHVR